MNESVIYDAAFSLAEKFSIELLPGLTGQEAYGKLQEKLAEEIRRMMETDPSGLAAVLYRIDVDEKKVRVAIAQDVTTAPAEIARLVIEREIQKVITRKQYGSKDGPSFGDG